MLYLIAAAFLLAGVLPFYSEYQYRHTPEYLEWANVLKRSYFTLDLATGLLFIATAVGLVLRGAWARTLALAILLAWMVKNVLLLLLALVFLERWGAWALLALMYLGKVVPSAGRAGSGPGEAFSLLIGVLAHPVSSRLVILLVGGTALFLVRSAYRYLRHDDAVEHEFGPTTVFGRSLRLRGRDLTLPALAAAYLAVPLLPMAGRLPPLRALRLQYERRAEQSAKAAREEAREDRILEVEFGPDLDSMIAFSARKGAVRVDLRSGKVRHLDPALYSYAGLAERYPERIRSRVTPDHRSFLNRENELVDVASAAKRPLRLEAPLGRPVVFLDRKQLVSLSPRGEFQWIELDPDRVTWTAPAFPEEEGASSVRFDELYISSSSDLAVTKDHPGMWGFHLTTPGAAVWRTAQSAHMAHVTADGSTLISAVGPVSRFSWSRIDPRTGPQGEKTVPLQSYRDWAGPPLLATDPSSQLAAWVMGFRVEVFRIRTLGTARVDRRIYDLEAAF
jgi:hypothetical protein